MIRRPPPVPPEAMPASPLADAFHSGLSAARKNWIPGTGLSCIAVLLIILYTYTDPVTAFFDHIAETRQRVGLPFGMLSTALFGGALPLLLRRLLLKRAAAPHEVFFSVAFWAYKGVEVGALYELQAWLWGEGNDPATLALKVFVDQAIYCPLLAVPTMVLGYLWQTNRFSLRRTRAALREEGYWPRALPVLITNAALWVPAVTVIYLFPTPLQLVLQNLILSIWVLLLTVLAGEREEERPAQHDSRS